MINDIKKESLAQADADAEADPIKKPAVPAKKDAAPAKAAEKAPAAPAKGADRFVYNPKAVASPTSKSG